MHSFAVSEEPVQGHQGHQGHRQTRHCSWRKLTESSQSQVISMVTAGIMAGCSITRHKCHNTLDNIWLDLTTLPRCWWTRSQGSRALKLTAFIIRIIYINLTDLTVYFIYFMTLWYLAFSLLVFATAFVQVLAGLQALTHAHARPCLKNYHGHFLPSAASGMMYYSFVCNVCNIARRLGMPKSRRISTR